LRIGIPLKSHDRRWGGPGTYTVEIVCALLRLDRKNAYVLLAPRPTDPAMLPDVPGNRADVELIVTDRPAGLVWDQLVLPRLARRHGVELLFSPFQSLPIAGRFAKVMTVHGAERYVVPEILDWRNRLKWRFMESFCLPGADAVLAVSRTMARDFCKATGYPEGKVLATPLGVAPRFGPIDDGARLAAVRARHRLDGDFVLFVGNLFPNKNVGNLLRAFATLGERIPHRLVIVGGRRWKYAGDLKLLDGSRLGERVRMLDFVDQDDLIALYSQASCFVFPSLYESFGLAMVEAMACGCPVVASRTGALPEVAADAALYCDPRDPASIAEPILRLATDPALRRSMAEKGLARAAGFTWERCARETLTALESVGRRRLPAARPARRSGGAGAAGLGQDVAGDADLLGADGQRRQQAQDVVGRGDGEQAGIAQPRGDVGVALDRAQADHQPAAAHLGDPARMAGGDLLDAPAQQVAHRDHLLEKPLL
jgi:glycosyltransferase involved in cell wall biosynthesis